MMLFNVMNQGMDLLGGGAEGVWIWVPMQIWEDFIGIQYLNISILVYLEVKNLFWGFRLHLIISFFKFFEQTYFLVSLMPLVCQPCPATGLHPPLRNSPGSIPIMNWSKVTKNELIIIQQLLETTWHQRQMMQVYSADEIGKSLLVLAKPLSQAGTL